MAFFRFILLVLVVYFIYKLFRTFLIRKKDNIHVKGNNSQNSDIQKKYADKIEDADFEEIE